jgi:hypothetical protein
MQYNIVLGIFLGAIGGGIVGYNLFSGAYDELWDIFYADQ